MAKYTYPAFFRQNDDGYSVEFPDIDGCITCGSTLAEAMEMAEDVLCLMLYDREEDGNPIPPASDIRLLQAQSDAIVSLVCCDTLEYRRFYDNKAVKKTLSIPAWLNTMAEKADINFSSTLQAALKEALHIT